MRQKPVQFEIPIVAASLCLGMLAAQQAASQTPIHETTILDKGGAVEVQAPTDLFTPEEELIRTREALGLRSDTSKSPAPSDLPGSSSSSHKSLPLGINQKDFDDLSRLLSSCAEKKKLPVDWINQAFEMPVSDKGKQFADRAKGAGVNDAETSVVGRMAQLGLIQDVTSYSTPRLSHSCTLMQTLEINAMIGCGWTSKDQYEQLRSNGCSCNQTLDVLRLTGASSPVSTYIQFKTGASASHSEAMEALSAHILGKIESKVYFDLRYNFGDSHTTAMKTAALIRDVNSGDYQKYKYARNSGNATQAEALAALQASSTGALNLDIYGYLRHQLGDSHATEMKVAALINARGQTLDQYKYARNSATEAEALAALQASSTGALSLDIYGYLRYQLGDSHAIAMKVAALINARGQTLDQYKYARNSATEAEALAALQASSTGALSLDIYGYLRYQLGDSHAIAMKVAALIKNQGSDLETYKTIRQRSGSSEGEALAAVQNSADHQLNLQIYSKSRSYLGEGHADALAISKLLRARPNLWDDYVSMRAALEPSAARAAIEKKYP